MCSFTIKEKALCSLAWRAQGTQFKGCRLKCHPCFLEHIALPFMTLMYWRQWHVHMSVWWCWREWMNCSMLCSVLFRKLWSSPVTIRNSFSALDQESWQVHYFSFSLINVWLSCFYKVLQPRILLLHLHFPSSCLLQWTLCWQALSAAYLWSGLSLFVYVHSFASFVSVQAKFSTLTHSIWAIGR